MMCNFQVTKRVHNIQLQKLLVIRKHMFHNESGFISMCADKSAIHTGT